jgi:hypothetical protein
MRGLGWRSKEQMDGLQVVFPDVLVFAAGLLGHEGLSLRGALNSCSVSCK